MCQALQPEMGLCEIDGLPPRPLKLRKWENRKQMCSCLGKLNFLSERCQNIIQLHYRFLQH